MLAVLVLLFFSNALGLTCYNGAYNFFQSTTVSPITSANCNGVCQLLVDTSSNVVQTASCVSAATCSANQGLAYPDGTSYSAVNCCTEDNCNDPRKGIPSATTCAEQTTETLCSQNINCGWCFVTLTCENGNPTGPSTGSCATWDYAWSSSTSVEDGFDVYLRPGVPETLTYTSPATQWDSLNLLILIDNTLSSQNVVNGINDALFGISRNLFQTFSKPVKFSVATYHDIPISTQLTVPQNYLFQRESKFSFLTAVASAALNKIEYFPETGFPFEVTAGLSALMYSANGPEIDWADGAFRVALVVTGNPTHVAGDGAEFGIYVPNNYDGVLDALEGQPAGSGEDYPAYAGIREVLLANGVYPLFGLADPTFFPWYDNSTNAFGFGSSIDLSAANSGGNITTDLINALTAIVSSTSQITFGDADSGFVVDVSGDSYTLYAATTNPDLGGDKVSVGIRNFASPVPFTFDISTVPPIRGCDGIDGSGLVVDDCGVCGGDNACIGCNSENSTFVFDACGICGGDNTSCVGCDGEIGSTLTFDVCGVCGGDGQSCIGCDGIVNSGKNYSYCGICGLEIPCSGSFHPLGIAGIVLICVGVAALCAMSMGVMAGKRNLTHKRQALKKDQLFIEAQQRHKLTKRKSSNKVSGQMQASSVA